MCVQIVPHSGGRSRDLLCLHEARVTLTLTLTLTPTLTLTLTLTLTRHKVGDRLRSFKGDFARREAEVPASRW